MKLSGKEILIGGGAVIALVIIYLSFFVYIPLAGRIGEAYQELKEVESKLKTAGVTIKAGKLFVKRKLPDREGISIAIDELTKRGRSLGINFVSINHEKIKRDPDSPYEILPIHMELESECKGFGQFLNALEKLEESVVTIESFKVKRAERIYPKVTASLRAKMYLMNGESEK
ncbi:MAG: type 4a pilus biogenesis protein PilO [Candidatus Omnitrophota bacterium]|nr:type 4a pilus biogenesis protein PilO [Candidatus Omnitrophota bacterium]